MHSGAHQGSHSNLTGAAGFDWGALPHGSVVVDVGGGVGSQPLALAKAFSQLKFVVQDQESTVADGKKVRIASIPA